MSTEIDELKQARYRSDKTISGHNAFLRQPTGETNSVDTRGFYFVLKEPHPFDFHAASVNEPELPGRHNGFAFAEAFLDNNIAFDGPASLDWPGFDGHIGF